MLRKIDAENSRMGPPDWRRSVTLFCRDTSAIPKSAHTPAVNKSLGSPVW